MNLSQFPPPPFPVWFSALTLLLLPVACHSSVDAASSGMDGAASGDALQAGETPEGGGSGAVSGSADGTPFGNVSTSYVIGAPDSDATTVVFVLSQPVSCGDLASPGWDGRIPNATQVLEIKFFGKAPGSFVAVTTVTPAPGEASINYTVSSKTGTPKELGSSGGNATLTSLTPGSANGTFTVKFGSNSLDGTFDAVSCPGGHEP